jgi:hypothetical protein
MAEMPVVSLFRVWSGTDGEHMNDLYVVHTPALAPQCHQFFQQMLRLATSRAQEHPATAADLL